VPPGHRPRSGVADTDRCPTRGVGAGSCGRLAPSVRPLAPREAGEGHRDLAPRVLRRRSSSRLPAAPRLLPVRDLVAAARGVVGVVGVVGRRCRRCRRRRACRRRRRMSSASCVSPASVVSPSVAVASVHSSWCAASSAARTSVAPALVPSAWGASSRLVSSSVASVAAASCSPSSVRGSAAAAAAVTAASTPEAGSSASVRGADDPAASVPPAAVVHGCCQCAVSPLAVSAIGSPAELSRRRRGRPRRRWQLRCPRSPSSTAAASGRRRRPR
jgi:hypothetical protein